jgi:hypothetical protein
MQMSLIKIFVHLTNGKFFKLSIIKYLKLKKSILVNGENKDSYSRR